MRIGYTLSAEEFGPKDLIKYAQLAENAGFSFLMISDHYHPWVEEQGESPFVWNMIGALSQVTKTVNVGIGVNCPIIRYHPAIVAQAAATSQVMLEGRFILGVGTGENLNEHVVGEAWPPYEIRKHMLEEAIEIMKALWEGDYVSYYGDFYTVDSAKIYTLPKNTIPIIFAAYGEQSATSAGKYADGFISTTPDKKLISTFEDNGGEGKPKYAQISYCYAKDVEEAKEIVHRIWPIAGIPGPLNSELKIPKFFSNVRKIVSLDEATKSIPLGQDFEGLLSSIEKYREVGYDNIYVHNIGPYQEEFIEFFSKKVMSKLSA